jgi:cytoskeleton protein RodZ
MSESAALPGAKLKTERERRGLSAQKAADEMHLDRWVIDALETDDYQRIGPTVYAKGHLKKYAALLGLPAAEIMTAFESRAPVHTAPVLAGPSMLLSTRDDSSSSGLSPIQVAGSLAAVVAIALVLWWHPWHPRSKLPANAAPAVASVSEPATLPPTDPDSGGNAAGAPSLSSSGNPAPALTPAPSTPTASSIESGTATAGADSAAAAPPAGAGRARLRLSFSADSWVDVHDADGKRTFAGNGVANSVKTISGLAPMHVYLGFGSGVQLEINNRAVAIGPQFFAGDVARFEAGADGVLRRESHPEQPHGAPPRNPRPTG